jgi:putative hemolysin
MSIGLEIFIIFLLILVNGFFTMSETAVYASRRARLQHRANEGDNKARQALNLAENPNRFLPTVQIGITLIGVLTGAVGGAIISEALAAWMSRIPALEPYAKSTSLAIVVILITFFSMLLGELVPKRLALQNSEKIAASIAGFMTFFSSVIYPIVWVLEKLSNGVMKLLGIKPQKEPQVTEEEILVQLDQGTQAGVFEEAEQDMVEGVFSLSDRRVNSLMVPRTEIAYLDINDTVAETRRKIAEATYSRFIVCEDSLDNVIGVVSAKDVLLADMKNGSDLKKLVSPPVFLPETAFGSRALEMFKKVDAEVMLVVDEFGVVQGLMTIVDLIEEIVGSVSPEEPQATQRQDGSWLLDGMLSVDDFKEIFNIRKLPDEEEYETLGGFVMTQLGHVPKAADTFEWNGLCFEVVDMDEKRVDKVLVSTTPARPVTPGAAPAVAKGNTKPVSKSNSNNTPKKKTTK